MARVRGASFTSRLIVEPVAGVNPSGGRIAHVGEELVKSVRVVFS